LVTVLDTRFVDVDGSGSNFYISFGTSGESNAFFSNASVSFFNNGAVWSGSLARTGGSSIYSIGDPAAAALACTPASTPALPGAPSRRQRLTSDTIPGTPPGQTASGLRWSATGLVPSNQTFLVSGISSRTYAAFNSTTRSTRAWSPAGRIKRRAPDGTRLQGQQQRRCADLQHRRGLQGRGRRILENVRLTFDGVLQAGETATFNMSANNVLTADQQNTWRASTASSSSASSTARRA
jgi:hypothetical protein